MPKPILNPDCGKVGQPPCPPDNASETAPKEKKPKKEDATEEIDATLEEYLKQQGK